jgi:cation transport protein ChaC
MDATSFIDDDPDGGAACHALPAPLAACVARRSDIWLFGYGSLMWNPGFPYRAAEPALLRGYHRRFCVYSRRYRGTPEQPGLVLGLDRGGSCRGVAFRIAACDAADVMTYLWEREMSGGSYEMREVAIGTAESGTIRAQTFVVRRNSPNYAGRLGAEEIARLILQGIGGRGHCREYLDNTLRCLEALGHVDEPLRALERTVKELAAAEPPCRDLPY